MQFFRLMFSETNGSPSLMRGMTGLVVVCVLGMWVYIGIRKVELQPMSPEMVFMVASALGVKAYQRGKEGSNGDTQFVKK